MASRPEAYVDTSAFIAFLDGSDTFHPIFRRLFGEPPSLVTTPLVIAEGHGWFLRRYDAAKALQFLSFTEDLRPLIISPVGAREQHSAMALLRRFHDQDLTLADAVGLCVMKERSIRSCWSTDRHLGLTGVPLVIHQ